MSKIDDFLDGVKTVAIAGHVNPDGDCIGSCMAVWIYLADNFPEISADVYLERPRSVFSFIEGIENARQELIPGREYDLLILLDISSADRIGVAGPLLGKTKKVLCFDHHLTNKEVFDWKFNHPEVSSTSEVLWNFLDSDRISEKCAEALYTGIVHDTGVFQYSCTSPQTMRIAASLMEKGIPFSRIVDESYYQKSYLQNQILGRALLESILLFDGRTIISYIRHRTMEFYGVTAADMEGIVSQLRNTEGVEVAIFMYEVSSETFRVSLRSKEYVDVSAIAQKFGGGGHLRAAGCTMQGTPYDVINNLTLYIEKDFRELGFIE